MEQLKQIGGRLLWKKSVAVILGLLGLCCPSSLWAEKLDTTFVLDMVIDSTPCYYTMYNSKGQITHYGIRSNSSSDFSHVNIGYVTDMTGKRVDTIYYVRDRVTKQWSVITSKTFLVDYYGYNGLPSFYDNGLLESIDGSFTEFRREYSSHTRFSEDGALVEEAIEDLEHGSLYSYKNYSSQYDSHGNKILYKHSSGSGHRGGSEVSYGSESTTITYKNQYDTKGNLIVVESTSEEVSIGSSEVIPVADEKRKTTCAMDKHIYDSLGRRIKTVGYAYKDSDYVLKDSVVYSYGHALREGEPCLLAVRLNGNSIDNFSSDKYHYDFSNNPSYYVLDYKKDIRYIVPNGTSVEEFSYDSEKRQLTISVLGSGSSHESSNRNTYTIKFSTPESYITSMTSNGAPVEDFSYSKYEYDFSDSTFAWSWGIDYEFSPGSTVKKSYDDSTNTLSISVYGADFEQDSSNMHIYSIRCKAPEAYLTSLSFNGSPVDSFSPTVFEYTLPDLYSPQERTISYTVLPRSLVTNTINGTSLHITIKDELKKHTNEYVINYSTLEACLTSLSIKGKPVVDFSRNKYEYDFSDSLEYHKGDVSYTLQQLDMTVNGNHMRPDVWEINAYEEYDDKTGVLQIEVRYDYIGLSGGTADKSTYVIKFKKPKPMSFLTSLELDGVSVDSFSTDKFEYDFSRYYYSSDINGIYSGGINLKKMSDDTFDTYRSQNELRWEWSKYATTDVSYDEETGIVSVTVKGENYAEDSSNIHVYKILTRKIDSMVIDSFHVSYRDKSQYSNDVKVIANKHQYEAFSNLLVAFYSNGRPDNDVSYSVFANIPDVNLNIQYSEASHTIIYAFSHKLIQSLVDTYYVALRPCVISINMGEDPIYDYEVIGKNEVYVNREYNSEDFTYKLPKGVVATESFDDSTQTLTLTARFEKGDTTVKTEYLFHFRPVDGVDDFLGDHVNLYATDKTICIDGATEPIYVYDLLCTMVGTGRGEEVRIPVAQAGVYVVRAGGKAAKVVVK